MVVYRNAPVAVLIDGYEVEVQLVARRRGHGPGLRSPVYRGKAGQGASSSRRTITRLIRP